MTATLIHDPETHKTGKLPPVHDPRTLDVVAYLSPPIAIPLTYQLPHLPKKLPMYLNDRLGDCAIAAPAHGIQGWTASIGHEIDPTDADVLAGYELVGRYRPADPTTDRGCVLLEVLRQWRVGLLNHKIAAFAAVDHTRQDHQKQACWVFGGLLRGLALPTDAQRQKVWKRTTGAGSIPGSWDGHAVWQFGFNQIGPLFWTWGQVKQATWDWDAEYGDETWACLSPDWINLTSPSHLNLPQLQADLAQIGTVES